LQRRIHPSATHAARRGALTPATLVVFDVLALDGRDLRSRPYWARREHLEGVAEVVETEPAGLVPRDVLHCLRSRRQQIDERGPGRIRPVRLELVAGRDDRAEQAGPHERRPTPTIGASTWEMSESATARTTPRPSSSAVKERTARTPALISLIGEVIQSITHSWRRTITIRQQRAG
jgi:hypothetical protein